MNKFIFKDKHIELTTKPKKYKKLTATRFATVMGLNKWATPFSAWCEITKTYEEPFEDNVYTIAGKAIEPKVINYLNDVMFMDLKTPTDVYGDDYFKKTWGDFFPDQSALGGMWDALGDTFVVEIKTTKRAEDWAIDVPIYYKLQACLYAYLLGFDDVVVTVSFLEEKDYRNPENFEPSYKNTKIYEFKLSEAFPTFKESYVEPALDFWNNHVLTGISPDFDEKKDADILKVLRTNVIESTEKDIEKMIKEADRLKGIIDRAEEKVEKHKKKLKELDETIKEYMIKQLREDDEKVEIPGKAYKWVLTKSNRNSFDSTSLKKELPDVYKKYMKTSQVCTLKKSPIEN